MKRYFVLILAGLIVMAILARLHVYRVESDCTGDLVWNSNEAYLFLGCGTLGHKISYLSYPFELFKELFGAISEPDHRKSGTIVLQIKPTGIQHDNQEEPSLDLFTPLDGAIFANHEGSLWKWSGTRFVEASQEEQQRLQGIKSLTGLNLDRENGWSKRTAILNQLDDVTTFPLELDGEHVVLRVGRELSSNSISIDLVRADNSIEQIWHIDRRSHSVNRSEYNKIFGGK